LLCSIELIKALVIFSWVAFVPALCLSSAPEPDSWSKKRKTSFFFAIIVFFWNFAFKFSNLSASSESVSYPLDIAALVPIMEESFLDCSLIFLRMRVTI